MCGIVGVVRRRASRLPPDVGELLQALDDAVARLDGPDALSARLVEVATNLEAVDAVLRGAPGVFALLAEPDAATGIATRVEHITQVIDRFAAALDSGPVTEPVELEAVNAALVRARDAVWALGHDRLGTVRAVSGLAGSSWSHAASLDGYLSIQVALAALDRLEVRGRDSAGLHLMVHDPAVDLDAPEVQEELDRRSSDPLFRSGSVRRAGDHTLSFVYKAAAEIGELGDNTAVLRAAITDDDLLRRALANDTATTVVLGHTRWASVGVISEANAHPLNQEETDRVGAYVVGALNGDVDNYLDLRELEGLHPFAEITTDTQVIPALVSRRLDDQPLEDAFRSTVRELEGSLAIGAQAAAAPGVLLLSLRGSGQALYVGLAEDAYVVTSEPYGLIEETADYLRLDGETPADAARASSTRGQVVVVDVEHAGELDGIVRTAFDGTALPVSADEVVSAEITTRDIDRGAFPHFLLKEISEAPASFRTTLRGRILEDGEQLRVVLGPETLPDELVARVRSGEITRVVAVGQGTAAVAAQSAAAILQRLTGNRLRADAMAATELSGFDLGDDMRDTLVVAISQSGTTTDTNRTVDLVRGRGASVLAIVNRRNSDLVDKSDGVLYTSDGRDLEMAVPSTKAFYAQVAAGYLLALAIATEVGTVTPQETTSLLRGLQALPDAMRAVLDEREAIAAIAARHVPTRRYWTVVGNGLNRIAANELRIKLSELCYRSISSDIAEDKKHIDLCTEPLILVCAAGLDGSNADDVAKEVAYHRAHRAAPIVIANHGEDRFTSAVEVIHVPPVHVELGFVLSAMAGHLFGYEAALVIDTSAHPLREARAAVQDAAGADDVLVALAAALAAPARRFLDALRVGSYDGNLDASTAVRIASLLRYALGIVPLDLYEIDHGKVGTPAVLVDDLTVALTGGIDELTRTIDTIKHQAKTVTVGISRADEELLQVALVRSVLAAGASRDTLTYRSLRTLVALDPGVLEVVGSTRYRIEGDLDADAATLHVVDTTVDFPSRTLTDPTLRGTKHRVATQREVTVARGRSDGRIVLFVPEIKGNETVGLTLLHVQFAEQLPGDVMRTILSGYQGRYGALKDAVTETVPDFDDAVLESFGVVELLTEPVYSLADRWPRS
ncbi:MAG TPA: SIS domain-containing protein [Acidimicrobiia bacterium]|nr:SIS domain-containing protein [Acidimicrobiia bacterium]